MYMSTSVKSDVAPLLQEVCRKEAGQGVHAWIDDFQSYGYNHPALGVSCLGDVFAKAEIPA
jgi:hypothetical protein